MSEAENQCLECDDKLIGRADKKLCSDQCRNSYNNKLNRDSNNLVRNVNHTLRKNRRILTTICKKDKATSSKDKLLQAGYNFNYFTNTYVTKQGSVYHFVYDMGVLELESEKVLIVRRDDD